MIAWDTTTIDVAYVAECCDTDLSDDEFCQQETPTPLWPEAVEHPIPFFRVQYRLDGTAREGRRYTSGFV